jgi:membrane protease YdiL (CAAX protease family)
MGLGLGAIFELTGSLLGPLLAHAIVNALNLGFLRDHDPAAAR